MADPISSRDKGEFGVVGLRVVASGVEKMEERAFLLVMSLFFNFLIGLSIRGLSGGRSKEKGVKDDPMSAKMNSSEHIRFCIVMCIFSVVLERVFCEINSGFWVLRGGIRDHGFSN